MPYYPPVGGGGSLNSGGLAGTGFYYLVGSNTPGLPLSKIVSAGSSVTIHTDSTSFYINAITGAGASSAGLAGTGIFAITWSGDTTLSNEKILTAGNNITITTDANTITVAATTGAGGSASTTKTYEYYVQIGSANQFSVKFERYRVAGVFNATNASTGTSPSNNQYSAVSLIVVGSYKIDTIAMRITTTASTNDSLIRLGLYTNSSDTVMYPFQAIQTSGIIAPGAATIVTASMVHTLSANTMYWLLCHIGTSTPTTRSFATAGGYPLFMADSGLGTVLGYGVVVSRAFNLGLPASCETGGTVANAPIMLAVRTTAG